MPGVGPITAIAIETFAPPMEVFISGRCDFAQPGSGWSLCNTGPEASRSFENFQNGAARYSSALNNKSMVIVRWACRKRAQEGTWLHRMLGRKPRMLVAIDLANKMACSTWAMLTKGEDYRGPSVATD